MSKTCSLTFSENEALVLVEFLSRFVQEKKLVIEDQAEERVLWNMCCDLETLLTDPFTDDYVHRLEAARSAVRDERSPRRDDRK